MPCTREYKIRSLVIRAPEDMSANFLVMTTLAVVLIARCDIRVALTLD